jgi:hypothetical protein
VCVDLVDARTLLVRLAARRCLANHSIIDLSSSLAAVPSTWNGIERLVVWATGSRKGRRMLIPFVVEKQPSGFVGRGVDQAVKRAV